MKPEIQFADFEKIALHIGTILSAKINLEAKKPAYALEIDFGPQIGIKKSSAQITDHYSLEDLLGKQILAILNFPPRQVARVMSQVLILGAIEQDGKVVLLSPDMQVENGLEVG